MKLSPTSAYLAAALFERKRIPLNTSFSLPYGFPHPEMTHGQGLIKRGWAVIEGHAFLSLTSKGEVEISNLKLSTKDITQQWQRQHPTPEQAI